MEEGPEFPVPPTENRVVEGWMPALSPPQVVAGRALGFYRLVLWLLPGCVAITTLVGLDFLGLWFPAFADHTIAAWFLLNIPSAIAAGIFAVKLEPVRWDGLKPRFEVIRVVKFLVLQLFIIPALTALVVIGCALTGVM